MQVGYKTRRYVFVTDCVHSTASLIGAMVERAREIKYKTFRRYVDVWQVERMLGYAGTLCQLKKDWSVKFYRSRYADKPCVYLDHGAIEYVFCQE